MRITLTANLDSGSEVELSGELSTFREIGPVALQLLHQSKEIADGETMTSLMIVVVPSKPVSLEVALDAAVSAQDGLT